MGTTTTTYADAVRKALDDLPAARYLELVDGLDEHLAEVQAEAGGTLADVLGPPETYAAELRASAGLPPRTGAGAPLPPPVAPAVTAPAAPARRPIDRGLLARLALGAAGALVVLWVLGMEELPTLKLAFIVAGVTAAMWLARRLLGAAHLVDRTARRVSLAIAVGGLVAATAFGSVVSERWRFSPVYNGPPVTFATVPYRPDGTITVPDFRGMTMARVNEVAASLGLTVQIAGGLDRIVMRQDPAPGTSLAFGSLVVLSDTPEPPPSFATTTTVSVTQPTVTTAVAAPATSVPPTTAAAPPSTSSTTVAPTTTSSVAG